MTGHRTTIEPGRGIETDPRVPLRVAGVVREIRGDG
jgi:hypothetical protein